MWKAKNAGCQRCVSLHKTKRETVLPILCLTALMLITALAVFWQFLFQRQVFIFSDIGADTRSVYYPFFASLQRKMEQGDWSFWDFTYGPGTNILTRQADVGSIFTWFICSFGADNVKYLLVIAQIAKVFLSGYICYAYLGCFRFGKVSRVLSSYIYAFNGFTMLWGQHYFFGTACLLMVFMLWAIEKALSGPDGYLAMIAAAFCVMITSYYFAYMVLLVAAVYALFRLFYLYSFKQISVIVKKVLGMLAAVIVGGLMAGVLFLPSIYQVMANSGRLEGELTLLDKVAQQATATYDGATVWAILSRMFSNNLMGVEPYSGPINYYEEPQWFFSSLLIFVALVFISELVLGKDRSMKQKCLLCGGFLITAYAAFFPLISLILNGFVTTFFRYTFVFMPLLALCFADVLERIFFKKLAFGKVQIPLAAAITVLLLLLAKRNVPAPVSWAQELSDKYLYIILGFFVVTMAAQFFQAKGWARTLCITLATVLIVLNVTMDAHVTNNERVLTSEERPNIYMDHGNDTVQKILKELQETDPGFYRVEKMFHDISYLNDAMLQGYYGVSAYNSVMNHDLKMFYSIFCPEFMAYGMSGYYDFRNIYNRVDITSLLGVKYILSYDYITDVPEYEYVKTVDSIHVYRNTATDGVGKFFPEAIDDDHYLGLSYDNKKELLRHTLVLHTLEQPFYNDLSVEKSTVVFERPENSGYITGTVGANQNGFVFLGIPYETGWTAYLDGEQVTIQRAVVGYSAIYVPQGTHTIELRYSTPMLGVGMAMSVAGFVAALAWSIVEIRRKNRAKKL